jgi:DNA replication protein DnaC
MCWPELLAYLKNANMKGILEKKLKALVKYDILIVHEMGYLQLDREGAHCFFQLVSRRY